MKITKNNINDVYKSPKCSAETMQLRGYELVKELFVDSSGFGADDEPALTQSQFMRELNSLLDEHGLLYSTITDFGQFQAYVGLFKKTSKSKVKRISTNVYERQEGNKLIVRLYDTDIVEIDGHSVTLRNGGFQTPTTKKWINKYLDNGYVFQKDFEWYYLDVVNKKDIPFSEGMTVKQ